MRLQQHSFNDQAMAILSGVVVANPAEDVLVLDFIPQPDPSGNFKPG